MEKVDRQVTRAGIEPPVELELPGRPRDPLRNAVRIEGEVERLGRDATGADLLPDALNGTVLRDETTGPLIRGVVGDEGAVARQRDDREGQGERVVLDPTQIAARDPGTEAFAAIRDRLRRARPYQRHDGAQRGPVQESTTAFRLVVHGRPPRG